MSESLKECGAGQGFWYLNGQPVWRSGCERPAAENGRCDEHRSEKS